MRWNRFLENVQKDIRLFLFILAMLCFYRIYFMFYMSGFMGPDVSFADILQANLAGFRLSLKTAGSVMLTTVVLCTLPQLIVNRLSQNILDKIRLIIGTVFTFIFSVLFQGRFPYYQEYNMTYGMQVLQGMDDDRYAIFVMMIEEYGLLWRFALALLLTAAGYFIWKKILKLRTFQYSLEWCSTPRKIFSYVGMMVACVLFFLFIRFGASFNYEHSINWENAGVTSDSFLNECILDDGQALYRVRAMKKRMQAGEVTGVHKDEIRELAGFIAGRQDLNSNDVKDYVKRVADGAKIPKPKHIFIILGETYAQWPMLDKYENLHVADGLKGLAAEENAYRTQYFMPNGDFTSTAITGMITGLSDVRVSVNYQPRSFKETYPTAMAPAFKELGYNVDFWYGGIPTWDNIKQLALAQGFDDFYGMPDFNAPKQSIWGTKDEFLFNAISDHLAGEQPTVHVIMTTTNHPPYNLDLKDEGFDLDREKQETAKMENVENSDELAVELGHHWYMDKIITEFVRSTMEKYPDSLFVVTGDHAVRTNPSRTPNIFEYQSVPFVLYGQGVKQDILPKDVVGGHTSIVPTIIELIAPKGFEYYSLADSMTHNTKISFNSACWMTDKMMGQVEGSETYIFDSNADVETEKNKAEKLLNAMRTLSWWMMIKGEDISNE